MEVASPGDFRVSAPTVKEGFSMHLAHSAFAAFLLVMLAAAATPATQPLFDAATGQRIAGARVKARVAAGG